MLREMVYRVVPETSAEAQVILESAWQCRAVERNIKRIAPGLARIVDTDVVAHHVLDVHYTEWKSTFRRPRQSPIAGATRTRRRTRPPRRPYSRGRRRGGNGAGGGPQGAEEGETQETGRERRSARRFGSWPRRRGHDREPTGHARPDDDERLVRDHGGVYSHAPPRDRRVVGNLVGVYI